MSETKSLDKSDVKKHLILVRYRKLDGQPWRRIGRQPQVETYLSDVSEQHRQPQIEYITASRIVIRVFDKQAIDLTKLIDQLGDHSRAVARCNDCLRTEMIGRDEFDFEMCLEPWY